MTEDSEKRFQSIMDKLFYAPKPSADSPSFSEVQMSASRGKKRPNPGSALSFVEPKMRRHVVEGSSARPEPLQAPLCRPWDRGDLMRRLATFKSMTWFGKPKVVDAVSCARRGWVNVDVDIISCKACGARLLFSTPSSWTQQQVEKAALVFSLKLDSGHKLLCPWIDNACDEMLAQFPPTAPPILVDKFRECSSALLQLLALPLISSSAIEYMRSPQLEQFLKGASILEQGNGSQNISPTDNLGNGCETNLANLYYQAQRLISLCGWEPRSLPYVVDYKDQPYQSNYAFSNPTNAIASESNTSITMLPVGTNGSVKEIEGSKVCHDPKSVVLDCRLCGASVGLWAFSTVPQPVDFFRLVGSTEINSENNQEGYDLGSERVGVLGAASNGSSLPQEKTSTLKFTIAGGPPPANQNFKATISLPVVGHNLRARFSYDTDFRDGVHVHQDTGSEARIRILSEKQIDITDNTFSEQVVKSGDLNKRHGHEQCSSDEVQSCCLNHDVSENGDTIINGSNRDMPLDIANATEHGAFLEAGANSEEGTGAKDREQLPVGNEAIDIIGKGQKQLSSDKAMEFDPIRLHRHFCPWIASTGSGEPGWKQTLTALQRQKESDRSSPLKTPSSASVFEVDDPIASVRRLFMSPSPKRLKPTRESS